MMSSVQKTHKIDRGIEVISAINGCPKQFHIVKKNTIQTKTKMERIKISYLTVFRKCQSAHTANKNDNAVDGSS
jgi:hypothetical protein